MLNNKIATFNWVACKNCISSTPKGCKINNHDLVRSYKFTQDGIYCGYFSETSKYGSDK